jgi:hypothetical protein
VKITHYHTSGPVDGMCKQSAIWVRGRGSSSYPLVYLQRPKWITDDAAWRKIVDSVSLKLPRGFDVT